MTSDGMVIAWVYNTPGGVVVECDGYGAVLVTLTEHQSVARAVLATLADPAGVGTPIAQSYDDDRRGSRSWEPIGEVRRLGRRGFTVVMA